MNGASESTIAVSRAESTRDLAETPHLPLLMGIRGIEGRREMLTRGQKTELAAYCTLMVLAWIALGVAFWLDVGR